MFRNENDRRGSRDRDKAVPVRELLHRVPARDGPLSRHLPDLCPESVLPEATHREPGAAESDQASTLMTRAEWDQEMVSQAAAQAASDDARRVRTSKLPLPAPQHEQLQPEVVLSDRTPAQEVVGGSQGELPYVPEVTARCGDRDSSAAMESAMEIQPLRPYGTAGRGTAGVPAGTKPLHGDP